MTLHSLGLLAPRTIGRLVLAHVVAPPAAFILSATAEPALPLDDTDRALLFTMRSVLSMHARGYPLGEAGHARERAMRVREERR